MKNLLISRGGPLAKGVGALEIGAVLLWREKGQTESLSEARKISPVSITEKGERRRLPKGKRAEGRVLFPLPTKRNSTGEGLSVL